MDWRVAEFKEGQELGSPAAVTTHIPQTSGVTQSVDLKKQGNGKSLLERCSWVSHCIVRERTVSLTYISD